jgi:secreted trypsin-like serine protease
MSNHNNFNISGDSGGPLLKVFDNTFVLVGMISWGTKNCGDHVQPAVSVDIAKYNDWIGKTIGNLNNSTENQQRQSECSKNINIKIPVYNIIKGGQHNQGKIVFNISNIVSDDALALLPDERYDNGLGKTNASLELLIIVHVLYSLYDFCLISIILPQNTYKILYRFAQR